MEWKMNKNAFKCRQTPKGRDLVEYSSKMFLWVFYQNPFFLSTGKYGGTDGKQSNRSKENSTEKNGAEIEAYQHG